MSSATLYAAASFGYMGALVAYIANLVSFRDTLRRGATVVAAVAFILQTAGLAVRWYEAGLHEVTAAEAAEGRLLEGLARFVTLASHPPWSNLYEIMVFMSWGIVLVFLVSEVRLRLRAAGVLAIGVALLALGIASLTLDATVRPLVPALRSYWLHFHVFSASIGYAAGLLAAITSLLYLAATRTHPHKVAFGVQLTQAILLVLLGRGLTLIATLEYRARVLGQGPDGGLMAALVSTGPSESSAVYAAMPGVGYLILLCLVAAIVSMVLHRRAWLAVDPKAAQLARLVSTLSVAMLTLTIVVIAVQDLAGVQPTIEAALGTRMRPGPPYRFGLASNQWDLGLFMMAWAGGAFSLLYLYLPERIQPRLPASATLDRLSYRAVMLAFTFVGILIVTGAIWAHYAWGRYWGWDPKETGSLIIWFVYAGYLHARFTHGLAGRPAAVIAIIGYFVVLAGFLGVNLGWFASGLHSYGGG